jgi:hypothetical protein
MFNIKQSKIPNNVPVEAKPIGINCILVTIPADNGTTAMNALSETIKVLNTPTRKITSVNCTPPQWGGYYQAWLTFEGDPLTVGSTLHN